ncbi:MAG: hypothetical protein ACI9R3_003424 [Verrucomicrobiales bacterium]|jgi:hypothetical protein
MAELDYRKAMPEDTAALCALLRETPMGEGICVCQERSERAVMAAIEQSNIWASFERSTGRAVGMSSAKPRMVLVDGNVREVRYLSDLRVRAEYRNGLVLVRGFQMLRDKLLAAEEWAQTLILNNNSLASRILTSGRGGLPEYRPFGTFGSWFMMGQRLNSNVDVRPARDEDAQAMQELLEREGPVAAFTPWVNFVKGGVADYWLATLKGEIVGMLKVVDTSADKATRIVQYSRWMRIVAPFYNRFATLRGLPLLPAVGGQISPLALTGTICRDRDPAILRSLLAKILSREGFYAIGMDTEDPLVAAMRGVRAYRTFAGHYLVGFGGSGFNVAHPFAFDFADL